MIVIVRNIPLTSLERKLNHWRIAAKIVDSSTPNEIRMEVSENYRAQVRTWFAHDDDVLWFSKPSD